MLDRFRDNTYTTTNDIYTDYMILVFMLKHKDLILNFSLLERKYSMNIKCTIWCNVENDNNKADALKNKPLDELHIALAHRLFI